MKESLIKKLKNIREKYTEDEILTAAGQIITERLLRGQKVRIKRFGLFRLKRTRVRCESDSGPSDSLIQKVLFRSFPTLKAVIGDPIKLCNHLLQEGNVKYYCVEEEGHVGEHVHRRSYVKPQRLRQTLFDKSY